MREVWHLHRAVDQGQPERDEAIDASRDQTVQDLLRHTSGLTYDQLEDILTRKGVPDETRRRLLVITGADGSKNSALFELDRRSDLWRKMETPPGRELRTLGVLEEIGVVRHIHLSHGPAIYERTAVSTDIRHLVCETCGRHVAVPRRVFDTARRTLERDYDFVLDGSHFAIVGRCRACANTQ